MKINVQQQERNPMKAKALSVCSVTENTRAAGFRILCVFLAACMSAGCIMWHPQWPNLSTASTQTDASGRLEEATRLGLRADSQPGIAAAVAAYKSLLDVDPKNYQAFINLSQLHLLLGDGYAAGISEKRAYFQKAMIYAEGAMFTNPSFRQSIQRGETTWEACRVLSIREMEAMLFWVNAVFYSYKEGQGFIGQVINFRWIQRAKQVMDHMTSINPDWGRGVLHFTWGIYFLSIPERMGGDRKKSADFFSKAIEVGPNDLIHRWGRAKYYHIKMKNPQGFRDDLEWVLSQDIRQSPGNAAWNVFFVRDARRLLDTMDRYF
jgi:hypothetical protein